MRPWLVACLHSLKKDRQGMSLIGDVHHVPNRKSDGQTSEIRSEKN